MFQKEENKEPHPFSKEFFISLMDRVKWEYEEIGGTAFLKGNIDFIIDEYPIYAWNFLQSKTLTFDSHKYQFYVDYVLASGPEIKLRPKAEYTRI